MKRSKKIYEGQRRHCCWCFSIRRWQVIRWQGKTSGGTARGGVRVGLLLSGAQAGSSEARARCDGWRGGEGSMQTRGHTQRLPRQERASAALRVMHLDRSQGHTRGHLIDNLKQTNEHAGRPGPGTVQARRGFNPRMAATKKAGRQDTHVRCRKKQSQTLQQG